MSNANSNPDKKVSQLIGAEMRLPVDGARTVREERMKLQHAIATHEPEAIARHSKEATRVAEMWLAFCEVSR